MPALDYMNMMQFDMSHKFWLVQNCGKVQRYMDMNVSKSVAMMEHVAQWSKFLKERPHLGRCVVEDFFLDNRFKYEQIMEMIDSTPGALALILGQVGKGKTALGLKILEDMHILKGKKVGMVHTELRGLPSYIKHGTDVFNLDSDTLWFLDEASLHANAREAMTKDNKELGMLLNIRRHQDLTLLVASQHAAFMDINMMRAAHYFFFKQLSWEEQTRKHGNSSMDYLLEYISWMMPKDHSETLFTDGTKWMRVNTDLPSFWTDQISKSYDKWTIEDAVDFIEKAMDNGMRMPAIEKRLAIRGFRWMTRAEIRRAYEEPQGFIDNAKAAGYK